MSQEKTPGVTNLPQCHLRALPPHPSHLPQLLGLTGSTECMVGGRNGGIKAEALLWTLSFVMECCLCASKTFAWQHFACGPEVQSCTGVGFALRHVFPCHPLIKK